MPACGGLAWRHLRFPPPEAAAELFAGEELEERMRLLVERIFDVYERAAPSLELLRREGPSLPVLARARDTLEAALDALIVAAAGDERAIPLDARARRPVGVARASRRGGRGAGRDRRGRAYGACRAATQSPSLTASRFSFAARARFRSSFGR